MFRIIAVLAACICVVAGAWMTAAAQKTRELNYMNDKLRISDSEKFNENTYVETGVELTFGVDRELAKVKVEIAEARDIQEELKHEDHSKALGKLRQRLKDGLAAVKAKGKP